MKAPTDRKPLPSRYLVVLVVLVGGVALASGLVDLYFMSEGGDAPAAFVRYAVMAVVGLGLSIAAARLLLRQAADPEAHAVLVRQTEAQGRQLAAARASLAESLEQQTATGEVLRVISSSPTDVQPVFDTIARSGARLCQGELGFVFQFDNAMLHFVAHSGLTPAGVEALRGAWPMAPSRGSAAGRAILDRRVAHIPDVQADPEYVLAGVAEVATFRGTVGVPMLRDGAPIGAITVSRSQAGPFSDRQIELLRTFADQAVIAVENARLFTEVQARNRDLTEALERQTATSEVLKVISRSAFDLQPVLEVLAENATRLCAAEWCLVYRFDGEALRVVAHHGAPPELIASFSVGGQGATLYPGAGSVTGRAAMSRQTVHVPDVLADPLYETADAQRHGGFRAALGVPMLRNGNVVGVFFLSRNQPRPFTADQIELVSTFADQAVIAIENVRLFTELEARNQDLTETLEQQTATAEILRVISSSPTDVQPVFDSIAESAVRLCEAEVATVTRYDGELLHVGAIYGSSAEGVEALRRTFPMRPSGAGGAARAVRDRALVHIPDVLTDPEYRIQTAALTAGFRGLVGVPMLREGAAIGAITLGRAKAGGFSDTQIQLLRTFADQAVIAVENVRLFQELETRNRDLSEALEQQTATAEILQAISGSPTDIQPVLDTVVRAAARFCGASDVVILRLDGTTLRGAAGVGRLHDVVVGQIGSLARLEIPVARGSVAGRAAVDRRTIHVADLAAESDDEYPEGRAMQRSFGHHTMTATPLLREGVPIGVIALFRMAVEPFSDRQLALLRLFADQAVIAIENVRLFTELETKNRDLTETLEQQTATSEVLKVISRSTFDLQPVLEALIESATRLCGATRGHIFRFDGEFLRFAAAYGAWPGFTEYLERNPIRPGPGSVAGLAGSERRVVHVSDVLKEPEYQHGGLIRAQDFRAVLAVPILREGALRGVIVILKSKAEPFSDRQIELVTTFADQAVIAIENVRLFQELEARNQDLTATLEQQTATSEVLRVISGSPTDVQPVFDTIARSAAQLCGAEFAWVFRVDGTMLAFVAHHGLSPAALAEVRRVSPMPLGRGSAAARSVLSRAVQHIPDVQVEPDYELGPTANVMTFRSIVAVPMLRDGLPLGSIVVARAAAGAFHDRQIDLLKTFADQGVIAVENVRLFTELEARNKDLTATLEQQTATGEILRVISSSPTDVQPVFDTIAVRAMHLCAASVGSVLTFDGELVHIAALANVNPEGAAALRSAFPMRPSLRSGSARAVLTGAPVHIPDNRAETGYEIAFQAGAGGFRSVLSLPMLRDGKAIGCVTVGRPAPGQFTDRQIALLKTFADQAVIAIENVRLFRELEARNTELTGTLARQTATGEVLRAISRAQTDAQPVFDIIAASALRLCHGGHSGVWLYDGDLIHLAALENVRPEGAKAIRGDFPRRADERSITGRAIITRSVVQVHDVLEDPAYALKDQSRTVGYRSFLSTPMLKAGKPIGAIGVGRPEPGPFPDSQVELLKTFADQAVIAIENVRLFKELETRNRDLTETLEQQTATGEVLKVISRSTFDLQPVLETLIEYTARLGSADGGAVYRFDGQLQRLAAGYNLAPDLREYVEQHPLVPGGGTAVGRAMLEGRTVHIHDVLADPGYTYPAKSLGGYRTILGVPMLREGVPIGVLSVWRTRVEPFTDRQIELVTTFADQGAIAIENVRLFQALEVRNRDLTESLEQQTATGEVLRVISASPTDVQPVFDAIARNAARLCEAQFCFVYRFDGDLLHFVAHHGVTEEGAETVRRAFPAPPSRGSAAARAVLDRAITQIPDVQADPSFALSATATLAGYRSAVGVPMLRDGLPIGSIAVARSQVGLLPERQVDLLRTFADQAVIAIENVRLFQELETRTQELTRSVGELRALGEVSQAVSSTLDLDTVLATIVSARRRALRQPQRDHLRVRRALADLQRAGQSQPHARAPSGPPGLADSSRGGRDGTGRGPSRARRGVGYPGRAPDGRTPGPRAASPSKECARSSPCRSCGRTSCSAASWCCDASRASSPSGSSRRSRRSPPSRCWPSTTPGSSVRFSVRSSIRTRSCRRAPWRS